MINKRGNGPVCQYNYLFLLLLMNKYFGSSVDMVLTVYKINKYTKDEKLTCFNQLN